MSFIKKIIIFIIVALSISFIVTQLSLHKEWSYAFVANQQESLTASFFSEISWENHPTNNKISSPENKNELTLILARNFSVKNSEKIKLILLEYDHRFSTEIYINDKKCLTRSKHLISSENPEKVTPELAIFEYGIKRVFLSKMDLKNLLKEGKNTIHIVVTNLEEISSFRIDKLSLKLLDKEAPKPDHVFTSSSLPILIINTNNLTIPDEPKIKASLNIMQGSETNKLSDSSIFHNIKIEVRGNTSQSFAKQSYSFNIYDSNYVKTNASLLDLPASTKWVLQGPYADKSLIRNALTYNLYRQMGNYAPKTQFIELVINNNYRGVYVLTEKIQVGKNHLNIPKLKQDKTDHTKQSGGYLLEIDRSVWRSNYPPKSDASAIPVAYCVYSPKPDKINTALEQKIKHQFNLFEQQLYNEGDILNYLDVNSFIDYLIITELTKNTDGYCLSTFLYNKNINNATPKFYIGPIWDYNLTFGLADYRDSFNPEGFVYNSSKYIPFWWKKLLENETFKTALTSRFNELRTTTLSNTNIKNTIDSLALICEKPAELNFTKWNILGGAAPWPNYYTGNTYNDEIDYIKNWTKDRLVFLDEQLQPNNKLD